MAEDNWKAPEEYWIVATVNDDVYRFATQRIAEYAASGQPTLDIFGSLIQIFQGRVVSIYNINSIISARALLHQKQGELPPENPDTDEDEPWKK